MDTLDRRSETAFIWPIAQFDRTFRRFAVAPVADSGCASPAGGTLGFLSTRNRHQEASSAGQEGQTGLERAPGEARGDSEVPIVPSLA